jgi:hypothetical protein
MIVTTVVVVMRGVTAVVIAIDEENRPQVLLEATFDARGGCGFEQRVEHGQPNGTAVGSKR